MNECDHIVGLCHHNIWLVAESEEISFPFLERFDFCCKCGEKLKEPE